MSSYWGDEGFGVGGYQGPSIQEQLLNEVRELRRKLDQKTRSKQVQAGVQKARKRKTSKPRNVQNARSR